MNSARYNSDCNGEVDGMKVEMVLVMVMMVKMISMMSVMMVMTISPSRSSSSRRNLPAGKVFYSL